MNRTYVATSYNLETNEVLETRHVDELEVLRQYYRHKELAYEFCDKCSICAISEKNTIERFEGTISKLILVTHPKGLHGYKYVYEVEKK